VVKAILKPKDVKKLMSGIQRSGFLELHGSYGTRNFSYTRTISVEMVDSSKTVLYRNGTAAPPAPEAFISVEKMIEIFVAKNLAA